MTSFSGLWEGATSRAFKNRHSAFPRTVAPSLAVPLYSTHHTIPKAVDLTDAKLRTDEDHSFYIGVLKKKINWRM